MTPARVASGEPPRARCYRLHMSLPSSENGFESRRPLYSSATAAALPRRTAEAPGRLRRRINADHGEWRSLVAHPAGGRAVAGSNPVSPIHEQPGNKTFCFLTERS
jgi:hypothetical protein